MDRTLAAGSVAAVMSGIAYAAATIIARSLANDGLGAETVLLMRFGIGGLLLIALVIASGRSLWPAPGERLAAALLGTVGYGLESSLFFAGLERGTAAAVTVLYFVHPLLVALAAVLLAITTATRRLVLAVLAGAAGTALVVVAGADVSISVPGIAFALLAAVAGAAYFLGSDQFLVHTDTVVRAAWVSSGVAVAMILRGTLAGGFDSPEGFWLRLVGIGTANAAAFGFLFAALHRIGATRTVIVMNAEPVAVAVLGAVFLGETLGPWQLLGGALVVAAAVAVALPEQRVPPSVPVHPPP